MNRYFLKTSLLILLFTYFASNPAAGQHKAAVFNPQKNDHIILLGNTFADRMRYYNYFETLLQRNYPDRQLTLRNMGWSADEVALQPRPLNFPWFGEDAPKTTEDPQDLSFRSWYDKPIKMPVALNIEGLYHDLTEQKADIIFLCFGMNESFKGKAGLPQFEQDLSRFIQLLQAQKFNGRSIPQLVLVSPIAHEKRGGHWPDPVSHNENLAVYTEAMRNVAASQHLVFIDLFKPSLARMTAKPGEPITINGIHLNDKGYQETARWMARQLGFNAKTVALNLTTEHSTKLRQVIKMKDDHFFYRWRAVNGEYIYGRRKEPFGVISFPPELRKLNRMVASLDSVVWKLGNTSGTEAYQKAVAIVDERSNPAAQAAFLVTHMTGKQSRPLAKDAHAHHTSVAEGALQPATTEKFTLPKGYEINLFASEKDFPLAKPVSMAFDAKGRLWVATMPTYPQYIPGIPVHDKILILEDTNGDGRADKHTVFADNLYLPLGFEFGNGGIYVSQEPDILFLKDTDGDDKADVREMVLTGFGAEDSHHATHAFTYGQDGALYFHEGTFLNTQVETPYGPVRTYTGATYRYEPRTGKLSQYISYGYNNPWGNVFQRWGIHLIADASDGSNYDATPLRGKIDYPDKHPRINTFTTTRVRPTAGIEIVSSRQFPDHVQGNFLINNAIGFQGIKQHQLIETGSGLTSKEVEPLLQSSDPNFRPVDLKFGPDGALYVVDWYNPLISHGENPPRDPARDKRHGRIWRITYKANPLLTTRDISGQTIPNLLNNLKGYEDRFRYRSRMRLREQSPEKVVPELRKWVTKLDKNHPDYELHQLEALWLFQDFDVVDESLLTTLLHAKNYRARAAATRVLFYWRDRLTNPLDRFRELINDESPRVRLEAIIALSHFSGEKALTTALDVLKYPTDYSLDYAINETFTYLKPVWLSGFKQNPAFLADNPQAAAYLLERATADELQSLPQTSPVLNALLTKKDVKPELKVQAIRTLSKERSISPVAFLIETLLKKPAQVDENGGQTGGNDMVSILLNWNPTELKAAEHQLLGLLSSPNRVTQSAAFAALITLDQSDQRVWGTASQNTANLVNYLRGISRLTNPDRQTALREKVKTLTREVPDELRKTQSDPGLKGTDSPFYPVHATAYEVLFSMPGYEAERGSVLKNFIAWLDTTPDNQRNTVPYNQAITLGKKLAQKLPPQAAAAPLAMLENSGTKEVRLAAVPAKMLFDQDTIRMQTGRYVSLVFENPDLMPHNVVILKPDAVEKVGQAADAMATLKDGFEKNFVPNLPEVLFATPLVNAGQNYRLEFKAPDVPGDYPFICSFPGHWRVMKGILKVVKPPVN
ncbi:PVC-type heme-binding CxxCH protein [Larkinella sp. GY13]|uniref:PVC-type heme-binding CxxCH protein n=1 Tax=Larkinella sp. GY13 TaxID=3453720 RepID=UPI003EEEE30C